MLRILSCATPSNRYSCASPNSKKKAGLNWWDQSNQQNPGCENFYRMNNLVSSTNKLKREMERERLKYSGLKRYLNDTHLLWCIDLTWILIQMNYGRKNMYKNSDIKKLFKTLAVIMVMCLGLKTMIIFRDT